MVTELHLNAYMHAVFDGAGFVFDIYQTTVVTAVLVPLAQYAVPPPLIMYVIVTFVLGR